MEKIVILDLIVIVDIIDDTVIQDLIVIIDITIDIVLMVHFLFSIEIIIYEK